MAVETVAESVDKFGYNDARDALRRTSQAIAILRAVFLAVDAQEDGCVSYEDNSLSRWQPAIDAATARVQAVADAMTKKVAAPMDVNWWTSLSILEAVGAALWRAAGSSGSATLESEQLQSVAEAAMDSMEEMYDELSSVACRFSGGTA